MCVRQQHTSSTRHLSQSEDDEELATIQEKGVKGALGGYKYDLTVFPVSICDLRCVTVAVV